MNNVQKIIKEICDEQNIKFQLVSNEWVTILENNNIKKYIIGYKFPLNDQSVGLICDDKYAVYEIMKEFNIPVVPHHIVFNNYNKEEIKIFCEKYNYNIVVKDNYGTCGKNMYHTTTEKELFKKIDKLLLKTYSVVLTPYYDIKTEYRNIVLNNRIELTYGKKRPVVIGNGKNTIYELLCEFNKEYFSKINDKKLNKILRENQKYEYNWQFNLSKGSMPFIIEDKIKEEKIQEKALEISNIIGTKFASIDLIELEDNTLLLLEINSGVMMDNLTKCLPNGEYLAKNIYSKAINEIFK